MYGRDGSNKYDEVCLLVRRGGGGRGEGAGAAGVRFEFSDNRIHIGERSTTRTRTNKEGPGVDAIRIRCNSDKPGVEPVNRVVAVHKSVQQLLCRRLLHSVNRRCGHAGAQVFCGGGRALPAASPQHIHRLLILARLLLRLVLLQLVHPLHAGSVALLSPDAVRIRRLSGEAGEHRREADEAARAVLRALLCVLKVGGAQQRHAQPGAAAQDVRVHQRLAQQRVRPRLRCARVAEGDLTPCQPRHEHERLVFCRQRCNRSSVPHSFADVQLRRIRRVEAGGDRVSCDRKHAPFLRRALLCTSHEVHVHFLQVLGSLAMQKPVALCHHSTAHPAPQVNTQPRVKGLTVLQDIRTCSVAHERRVAIPSRQ
eukprot:Rhum_TRINITY_DN16837_c0_g1::Rhum_TRINITY_DN16837_c0_g1_i1::g.164450::m.164450